MRSIPICSYPNVIIGDIRKLQQKLDAFCVKYQNSDCLYTLFEYRFKDKAVVKIGQVFDNVQRAAYSIQRSEKLDRIPSLAKKDCWEKSAEDIY